jgi:hypothetical protein
VHDLVVHPRDNELVAGTHGLSVFVLDVSTIQRRVRQANAAGDGHRNAAADPTARVHAYE